MTSFYRRRLPHLQPDGAILFVTFRLFGSLPDSVLEDLRIERERLRLLPARTDESPRDRALCEGKRLFGLMDNALAVEARLSMSETGNWLRDPALAGIVRDKMRFFEGERYREHRYVLMPNHVHWLLEPLKQSNSSESDACWPIGQILKSTKGTSSSECNQLLGRIGPFWQDERYDHVVRDAGEYQRIVSYIDGNPVQARLCASPADWFWGSAGETARS